MAYSRTTWADWPSDTTPITAARLNNIEDFISGDGSSGTTAFTPTWTNLDLGTGATNAGSYAKVGRIVWVRTITILGTGGSASGLIQFAPPVTPRSLTTTTMLGLGVYRDVSAAIYYFGRVANTSTTAFSLYGINASATIAYMNSTSASSPMTWDAGDYIYTTLTYEAA